MHNAEQNGEWVGWLFLFDAGIDHYFMIGFQKKDI